HSQCFTRDITVTQGTIIPLASAVLFALTFNGIVMAHMQHGFTPPRYIRTQRFRLNERTESLGFPSLPKPYGHLAVCCKPNHPLPWASEAASRDRRLPKLSQLPLARARS